MPCLLQERCAHCNVSFRSRLLVLVRSAWNARISIRRLLGSLSPAGSQTVVTQAHRGAVLLRWLGLALRTAFSCALFVVGVHHVPNSVAWQLRFALCASCDWRTQNCLNWSSGSSRGSGSSSGSGSARHCTAPHARARPLASYQGVHKVRTSFTTRWVAPFAALHRTSISCVHISRPAAPAMSTGLGTVLL